MNIHRGFEEKSRLGRLLVNRGYLSDSQLDDALHIQRETGERLGEVLVDAGWITEKDLKRVLKHQSRYRNAAALVAVVALPLQPLVSFAANHNSGTQARMDEVGEFHATGLMPMSEDEMAGISGQADNRLIGQLASISAMVDEAASDRVEIDADAIEALKFTANIFVPILNFLDSSLSIYGVHYREGEPRFTLREDGGLTLTLPERIEQIRLENIRVTGSRGPSMGNVTMTDIRFDSASNMTIYTH
ncbi:pilus assembly protein PilB [Marinobacter salinisoli]|uniref:Pilus assembly protein PilB n=1 Tax=Marinobacter salinisoli TaxID=2769486 RepID=A0ABX7MP29_9GAMM|nr:pilus assembly protein PilB [Marinobacter salinisoli]QSP94036.1 pilus assembly protein PilB [Marinobacter salinisoli]